MRRFILIKGGVETQEYFSFRMADVLIARGYEVLLFSLWDLEHLKELNSYLNRGDVVLLTFNFHGLEREEIFLDDTGTYLWDIYGVKCVNIVVDHPFYYHKYLLDTPKQYAQICIDFSHADYMSRFYPDIKLLKTMPLAGTQIQERKPWKERKKLIVFTGNYAQPEKFECYMTRHGMEYERFYRGMVRDLLEHTNKTMEEVFEFHMKKEMKDISNEDLRLGMSLLIFIDLYIRFYFRGEVVRTLVDAGFPVHLFGSGWEKLCCRREENRIIGGSLHSEGCLEQIADAKLSLNVMPWFKRGAHDRIYNSMLNGAVSVSDTSEYLVRHWKDGKDILYYSLDAIEELPDKLNDYLKHPERLEQIAEQAYQRASQQKTWENYTEEILKHL